MFKVQLLTRPMEGGGGRRGGEEGGGVSFNGYSRRYLLEDFVAAGWMKVKSMKTCRHQQSVKNQNTAMDF